MLEIFNGVIIQLYVRYISSVDVCRGLRRVRVLTCYLTRTPSTFIGRLQSALTPRYPRSTLPLAPPPPPRPHTNLNPLMNVLRTILDRSEWWEQAHEWTGLWMSGLCPAGDKHYRRGQLTVHVDKPCSTFVARVDLGLSNELMRLSL